MQKANVKFTFEQKNVIIQCSTDDNMKDICQKYANKMELDINSLIFLYAGGNLNFQLSFKEQVNELDIIRNEMNECISISKSI